MILFFTRLFAELISGQLPRDILNALFSSNQSRELEALLKQFDVLDVNFEALEMLFKQFSEGNIDQ